MNKGVTNLPWLPNGDIRESPHQIRTAPTSSPARSDQTHSRNATIRSHRRLRLVVKQETSDFLLNKEASVDAINHGTFSLCLGRGRMNKRNRNLWQEDYGAGKLNNSHATHLLTS